MLGVDPLPPPGVKREVAAGEKAAGEEENTADEATEPDTKRPRIAEEKES